MEKTVSKKRRPCPLCGGFGRYQSYIGGMVVSVYCECPSGREKLQRIAKLMMQSGAINNESNE